MKDLSGKKFGMLLVLKRDLKKDNFNKQRVKSGEIKRYNSYWICKCDCGNTVSILINKNKTNCGCIKNKNSKLEDLSGKKFNKLTVIDRNYERTELDVKRNMFPRVYWNCICDCGNLKIITSSHLKSGASSSCGCSQRKSNKRKIPDLVGKNFGLLKVVSLNTKKESVDNSNKRRYLYYWNCQCSCGKNIVVENYKLTKGITLNCGCVPKKYIYNNSNETRALNNIKENGSFYDVLKEVYSRKEIKEIWSKTNKINPNQLTKKSHQKIFLICPICKEEFATSPLTVYPRTSSIFCKNCFHNINQSSIEREVLYFLKEKLKLTVLNEWNCNLKPINPKTNGRLFYDNEIVDYNLIIEVHGQQHYKELEGNSHWLNNLSPKEFLFEQKYRDLYKKEYAENNGYSYLEISYLDILNKTYTKKILDKIKNIKEGVKND